MIQLELKNVNILSKGFRKKIKYDSIKCLQFTGLLNEENDQCSNDAEISGIVQIFYQDLFKSTSPSEERIDDLLTAVQPLVTEEINNSLEQVFSSKEIEDAIFSISTDKSPGPEG